MAKFLRPSKIVILTSGRYAGKKAVIVKNFDDAESGSSKSFGCALVAGIDLAPRKVSKDMPAAKIARRCRVKPFMKVVNYTHIMPTRYSVDLADMKVAVGVEEVADPAKKKAALAGLKGYFEDKYKSGQAKWFFQKLRF